MGALRALPLLVLLVSLPVEAAPGVSRARAEALVARWRRTRDEVRAAFDADPALSAARWAERAPARLRARALRLEERLESARERVREPAVLAALVRSRAHDELVLELTRPHGWFAEPEPRSTDDEARDRLRGMVEVRTSRETDRALHEHMPYMITRDLRIYAAEHGEHAPAFEADVAGWHDGMKILDGGAGEGRFFAELTQRRGLKAEMIAVGIKIPPTVVPLPSNVRYLEGELGADPALEARLGPGTFDRIVDTLGAASYTRDLGALLGLYGRLLKPGGKAFIAAEGYLAHFVRRDGTPLPLPELAGMLKGFRVEYAGRSQLALVRTEDPIALPSMRLIGRVSPLDRRFRVTPAVGAEP